MNTHPARQAQAAVNQFLFEASLLAGELDTIRRIENPEQRTFVLRRGEEVYSELLRRSESLRVADGDVPLIQALLERIRSRLKSLS